MREASHAAIMKNEEVLYAVSLFTIRDVVDTSVTKILIELRKRDAGSEVVRSWSVLFADLAAIS